MLISSPRHTPADLALWLDLEAADLEAARLDSRRLWQLIQRAIDEMRAFAAAGPCYLSCSWGKDSVVLLAVSRLAKLPLPIVWIREQPHHNPDCELVADEWFRRWPLMRERYHVYDVDHPASGTLGTDAEFTEFKRIATAAQARFGRRITGIRASESSLRTVSAAVHGYSTEQTCRPLLRWRTADIFAFAAAAGLPLCPVYACLGGGRWDRERVRTDCITSGTRSAYGMGRDEWEREYYPEVVAAVQAARQ